VRCYNESHFNEDSDGLNTSGERELTESCTMQYIQNKQRQTMTMLDTR